MAAGTCLAIFFGDQEIEGGSRISTAMASEPISFEWPAPRNSLHTLLIYAKDPLRYFYAAVNIPEGRLDMSEQIVPYVAPVKPEIYRVELLQQSSMVASLSESSAAEEIDAAASQMSLVCLVTFEVTPADDRKAAFCRCALHVAAKQSPSCLEGLPASAGKTLGGRRCYNPYPVCAKTTGTTSRDCAPAYAFDAMPDDELKAYARLKKIPVPRPYNRDVIIERIKGRMTPGRM